MNNIELLSPAGSALALTAAVQSGADAVYTGGELFSARQGADNFSFDDLCEYVKYCHLYGVKIHVAVNTLIKQKEIPQLCEYLKKLGKAGIDAIIVQDIGAAVLMKQILPEVERHASTQMTVTNLDGVRFLEENGFCRVVLAREMSMENIEYICKGAKAEIETFVHGALCISYSGQCLMSSIIGGRSGNRGRCAQPCRLPYTLIEGDKKVREGYLMSPKDLCLINRLNDLKRIGVASLKIEGRLKRPEYVSAVTGVYRKYLDNSSRVDKADYDELLNAFNRSGFTGAYFASQTGRDMMSIDKPGNDSSNTFTAEAKARAKENANVRKIKINIHCSLFDGDVLRITAWDNDGHSCSAEGTQKSEKALNKAITADRIKQQLLKTGSTPFEVEDCMVELDDGITVPISEINELRRCVLEDLKNARMSSPGHTIGDYVPMNKIERRNGDIKIFAEIHTKEQFDAAVKAGVDGIYVPLDLYDKIDKNCDVQIIAKMPDIVRDDMNIICPSCDDVMITHFGQKKITEGKNVYGDFRLNIYNSYTADFYSDLKRITISPELNLHEIRELLEYTDAQTEIIAYGRLPLMITQNCPAKQYKCSHHKQIYSLSDRMGEKFPIICQLGCSAKIVNSKPVYMADKIDDIKKLKINSIRLIFTVEKSEECGKIISVYKSALNGNEIQNVISEGGYTRGHFYRGVL